MRRAIAAGALALVVVWLAPEVWRALRSHQARLRDMVAEAAAAFDAKSMRGCLRAFHSEYRDETARVDRDTLQRALAFVFLRRRLRVRVPEEHLEVELDRAGESAHLTFRAILLRKAGASWREVWEVRVEATARREGGRWKFWRSRHETVSGRRPW